MKLKTDILSHHFFIEFHDPLSSDTMKFHFTNDLFTAHIQKTPFIQEQTRQMVEFTLLCDMTTFCTNVAVYVLPRSLLLHTS